MNKRLKIVFMATPDFAVPALTSLHQSDHDVALVVTQPDRPKGRGRRQLPPPVKVVADHLGIPVAQPPTVKSETFIDRIRVIAPDLLVVVAYGQILPPRLLSLPPLGAINVHASLLPKYRGPAPIQWAIINREPETGVTIMAMDAGLDTGDILRTARVTIGPEDTAGSMHTHLALLGAETLLKVVNRRAAGPIAGTPQDNREATFARLLRKEDGHIDWTRPAGDIEALIRGTNPWPGAFTFLGEQRLKFFSARPVSESEAAAPGTVIKGFADELRVAAGQGALSILELQAQSGKRLAAKDYLRGKPIPRGTLLK